MAKCTKKKYAKAGAARHAMNEMRRTGKVGGDVHVYPCGECGGWHWGHISGGGRAVRAISAVDHAIAADKMKRERAREV